MRIVGSIPHPRLKITVFQMNDRFSVKLESGLYEQTYKFRQGSTGDGPEAISRLLDTDFLEAVEQDLEQMHRRVLDAMKRQEGENENDEFDVII
jgi:hypothetical protein